nr:hypothetical protein [Pseudohalocynthiibacter aestuariivivens]
MSPTAAPNGFPALVKKLIALEHSVALFRLLGGGMGDTGDMGQPLPGSRLAVLPTASHTAVIAQSNLTHAFIESVFQRETPKELFE